MQDTTTATVDLDGPTTLVDTTKLLREIARLVAAEMRRHLDETDHRRRLLRHVKPPRRRKPNRWRPPGRASNSQRARPCADTTTPAAGEGPLRPLHRAVEGQARGGEVVTGPPTKVRLDSATSS
jgi:hypothetical protein